MCRTILLGLIVLMVTVGRVKADEGMWLLPFLKQQNSEQLKKLGDVVADIIKRTEIRRDA